MSEPMDSANVVSEVSVTDAWRMLNESTSVALVDVRTKQEWAVDGVPDLAGLDRDVAFVEWNTSTGPNENFIAEMAEVVDKETPVLLLCRSGARSLAAAHALAEVGYERPINVMGGFGGKPMPDGSRIVGWRELCPSTTLSAPPDGDGPQVSG